MRHSFSSKLPEPEQDPNEKNKNKAEKPKPQKEIASPPLSIKQDKHLAEM